MTSWVRFNRLLTLGFLGLSIGNTLRAELPAAIYTQKSKIYRGSTHSSPATTQPQSKSHSQEMAAHSLCVSHIVRMEQEKGIPKGLLSSIAKIESGKKFTHTKGSAPWPWVINAGGEGRFFKTRGEAIAAVNKLVKEGKKNVDIGCMQISYLHHGHKFDSVAQMFDPATNVEYGASFLKNLYTEHKSWLKAVGMYHSATLKFQVPYKEKVLKAWQTEKNADYRDILLAAKFDPEAPLRQSGAKLISGGWVYQGNSPLFFMVKGRAPETVDPSQGKIERQKPGQGAKILVARHAPRKIKSSNGTHERSPQKQGLPRFFKPVDGTSE